MAKLFITAEEVNSLTDGQANVKPHYYEPRLPGVQKERVKPVLGASLYAILYEAVQSGEPLDDRLAKLLEAVKPVMGQWVLLESLPFLYVQITNSGAKTPYSERAGSEPTDSDKKVHAKAVEKEANRRTNDLKDWLEENRSLYPEYVSSAKISRIPGGLFLGL